MLIKNGAMQIELKEDIGRLEQEIQELLKLRNIILKATNMQVLYCVVLFVFVSFIINFNTL